MSETVIYNFKEDLKAILFALGKVSSENDLKKMYREQTGHSINQKLQELGEVSLHNFLRFKCRDICEISRFDNEIKIQRISTEASIHMENLHKAKKRPKKKANNAPKLNIPQNGIVQKTTFNRLNPQGFNKYKTTGTNKNLINAYRYPNPVNLEDKENVVDAEESNEYAYNSSLTFQDFVGLESSSKAEMNSVREELSPAAVLNQAPSKSPVLPQCQASFHSLCNSEAATPNVKNRSDFPSLSIKENKLTHELTSDDDSEEFDSVSMQYGAKSWSKVAQQKASKTPVRSRISKVSTPPKITAKSSVAIPTTKKKLFAAPSNGSYRPIVKLEASFEKKPPPTAKELFTSSSNPQFLNVPKDDPIYLIGYYGVILDPSVKLSKPLHRILQSKLSFPVNMSIIDDPAHFCLQYDETILKELFNNMQRYYEDLPENGLLVHEKNLKNDLLVAVKVFNFWHRATICQTTNDKGNVLVMFSDFGHSFEVPRDCIRHMLSAFTDYPQLFFRAQLAGILPQNSSTWSVAARNMFHNKVYGKELFAVLRSYDDKKDVYEVDLSEKLTSSTTIAEDLIQARLAKAVSLKNTFPYAIIFPCCE